MNKKVIIPLTLVAIVFGLATTQVSAVGIPLTKSFGGKVYLAPIPGVTCIGIGKSALLSSNVGGLTKLMKSVFSSPSKSKAIEKLSAIYDMIPVYTTSPEKVPKTGIYILGKEKMIPDLKTCKAAVFGGIPIPVLKTTENYNVSQKLK